MSEIQVYVIPDTSWYKPVKPRDSPRDWDRRYRRSKKKLWLPRKVRKHPKMREIFGNA